MDRKAVFDYAYKKYKSIPEYLWARDPEAAVLRHGDNRKWYAVIMRVSRDKLGLSGTEKTDILDVKSDPEMIGFLRMTKGILAGYHMNKENWITVLLDGSVDRDRICSLLDMSYELTRDKGKAGKGGKRDRK